MKAIFAMVDISERHIEGDGWDMASKLSVEQQCRKRRRSALCAGYVR
jgi:hypothetical protein